MSRFQRSFVVLGSLVASASSAAAQDTISTDRPGFLFSSSLVPEGRFQVEAGLPLWAYDEESGASASLLSTPVQLRYGLHPALELRLGMPVYNWLNVDSGSDEHGAGDMEVGLKTPLPLPFDQDAAALIAGVRLPTGDDDFSVDDPATALNAVSSWTVLEDVAFTGLAGLTYTPIEGDDDALVGALGGLAGKPLPAGWTGYAEAIWFPGFEDVDDTAFVGVLATKLLSNKVQLDFSVDRGLTDESTDWVLGAGLSFYAGS